MLPVKIAVLVLGSLALAYLSRASLRAPRSHGFYRFFAWEAILVLALLNIEAWFRDPLSWHQIVSWILLLASGFLVIHGVHLLRQRSRPDVRSDEAQLIAFERTTSLVTSGAYRYVRHPLYSSLLFLAWGIFFKLPSWPGVLAVVTATACLVATARVEEAEDVRFFGDEYRAYMRHTRMFVPFLF